MVRYYNLILIFSSLSVVHSLKCHLCEFQMKLGNHSFSLDECSIAEDNIGLCKSYIQIDYRTNDIYIWWNAIPKDMVEEIAYNLDISLPLNRMQKSLTKFQFDMKFQPDEEFVIGAVILCQSNDFCIVDETQRLLSQLSALKYAREKIREEMQTLLITASPQSTVHCFHSFSDEIIECTSSHNAACFIGLVETSTELEAGCTRDTEYLFASVSYHLTNPRSSDKASCSIHCNRENCNTKQVYNQVIKIAQKYLSTVSQD